MGTQEAERTRAAEIIRDAGGRIIGRTRLQKIAYLLDLAGFGCGFRFEYRHYGPFSEDLASAIQSASAFGLVSEDEKKASWGGVYSIYSVTSQVGQRTQGARSKFAEVAAAIGSIELELAATAAFLSVAEGCKEAWKETARRKPEKAGNGRLEGAMQAYKELQKLKTPKSLPEIA